MRKIFLFFIFSVSTTFLFCQDKKEIDSLVNALKTAHDTIRVNILGNLSDKLREDDPKRAMKYANEAIQLSQQLDFSNGLFQGYMGKALAFYDSGELDSALRYLLIAKTFAEKNNNNGQLASVYSNLGNVLGNKGQYKK